jgi:hypothetical protein
MAIAILKVYSGQFVWRRSYSHRSTRGDGWRSDGNTDLGRVLCCMYPGFLRSWNHPGIAM